MNSKISIKKPFEAIAFNHFGELKDFIEVPNTIETEIWSGSEERYELNDDNGATVVTATMDVIEEFGDFFNDAFPKALQRLKEIAESETKSITVRIATKESLEKAWVYQSRTYR